MSILKSIIRQVVTFDLSTRDIKFKVMDLFGVNERDATLVIIHAKNEKNKKEVAAAKKRLVFLPNCLRNADRLKAGRCAATFDENGFHCRQCEPKCQVGQLERMLKSPVYTVPGSTMLFRIIKREKPDAVIGVGCVHEIEDGLAACEKIGLPAIGIVLANEGCFNTLLDFGGMRELLEEIGELKNAKT
ncbi:MAG: DUF116 domain-containing protein [Candidatus Micrarchaeota archaeon]